MISVLILTHNEEQDLPGCLDAVEWCDDVHVLDSGSSDGTVALAEDYGAHVSVRPFDDFAGQRNAGMRLPFRHGWVLVLDADERPTKELLLELRNAVASAEDAVCAFEIRRRDFLWGTWLKHAQMTPFYLRLFRVGCVRYTRAVNETTDIDGQVVRLKAPIDHLAFSKGVGHWVAKHNHYSDVEAQVSVEGTGKAKPSWRQALFAEQFHERRIAQKALFYCMPARPLVKWMYLMFVRGAFLDGAAGVMYATLISYYEYLIVIKTRELLRVRSGQPL